MKIYLDTCAMNRIFDDQSDIRILLESYSMITIIKLIENNSIDLITSDILVYENDRNPYIDRKTFVNKLAEFSFVTIGLTPSIKRRAKELEQIGIKSIDALHLASAELSKVDYFISCDDNIIKKYKGALNIYNPINFLIHYLSTENKP